MDTYTQAQLIELVEGQHETDAVNVFATINRWLERGDGVAVYENHDLSSPDLGDVQIVSFGSPDAQLEVEVPPTRLPDIGGAINWRYQLVGTYRGEPVLLEGTT